MSTQYKLGRAISSIAVLVSIAITLGCSTSSPPPAEVAKSQARSMTLGLAKLPGWPQWNLESVGPINNAWKDKTFELPAKVEFTIVGWAVDQNAKAAAGGLEIAIDGVPYAAQYGKERPDVAKVFNVPAYANSGFFLHLLGEQFTPGDHVALFRVLSNDRKSYWEAGPYTINFK